MDPWKQQWNRVQRWLSRFRETNDGRAHDRDSDYYQDEAYAFFLNCYHLKDWLVHDPASAGLCRGDVDRFIAGSINMKICSGLCLGSKHLRILYPQHGEDPNTEIGHRH